ncbi:MAG: NosD domain-containing protein, partial [Bacteroidales bacterium]
MVWVNITGDLPPMTFTQIRFSDIQHVMRIGSTGRGLWEAPIPCGYEAGSINITGAVAWNDTRTIKKNIYVKNGGTLTVTGDLYMGENIKIVVERGGLLLLDGALLTSYCGGLWQGIEVWGNPKQASTLPYQGKVVLRNGSIIENAVNGIRAAKIVNGGTESELLETKYAGGIIQAVESEFRNNKSDVAMYKYPATGYTFQNSSFFRKCEFVTDKMYFTEYDTCTHVKLSEVNMVKFHACGFKNESFEPYYGKGIYSFNSAFLVEGIDTGGTQGTMWDRTEFYNLKYGIYATAATTLPYADVRHSHFNDNERGLYLGGMSNARVTENLFELFGELEDGTYGLYLDYSTGYMVEENEFVSGIASNFRGAGIIVNNSGEAQNELYNNYFYRLETAILAQNCNRSLDYLKGLKIKCNDHDFNKRDILVIADSTCSLPGVSINQGAPGATEMQAGNTFSWFYNPLNPTDSDFENIEDGPVTY